MKPMLVKIKVMESSLFEDSPASTPESINLSEEESESEESADLINQSTLQYELRRQKQQLIR